MDVETLIGVLDRLIDHGATVAVLLGTYLRMFGISFKPDHATFLSIMMGVVKGSIDFEKLVDWVQSEVN